MEAVKDARHLYEVERRAFHAERPGFRINELQISPKQKVPWHYHNNIQDTFYVLEGNIRIFLRDEFGWEIFPPDIYLFDNIPTHIDHPAVLKFAVGACVSALVFAIIPAVRAARLRPVRALRYE